MTTGEMISGICNTTCKTDLKSFLDGVDDLIESGDCLIDEDDWPKITEVCRNVISQFDGRVHH